MKTQFFQAKALALTAMLATGSFSGGAYATVYYFSGSNAGGTGSATLSIDILGNTLTATLNNTSPINLDGGSSGGNSPGITGFGFNLNPSTLSLASWTLTAYEETAATNDGNAVGLVTIGSSAGGNDWDWVMGTTLAAVTLDFLPTLADISDGRLFNPLTLSDLNNTLPASTKKDRYFTTAILEMNFGAAPTLVVTDNDCVGKDNDCSPFVRMQNVGINGGGSLKLEGGEGENGGGGTGGIPEPGVLFLMGAGLLGLAVSRRRLM